jgi:branched-chain amino acid transport system ATP-binding protein
MPDNDETAGVLRLDSVSSWYGTAQALFDVSLELRPGEMVGLLGRNGAGKSTTLKSVLGIEARRTGTITYDGVDISRKSAERVARQGIAWVPPDRRIFSELSVLDNLALAARARRVPLDLDSILEVMPIMQRLIDRRGHQLSGGEQQAVAIARALAGRPRVLLLDEPTEGLAPLVVQQLEASIAELPERFGVSVVLAEQNLQFILRLTSRVYVLETGRVVFDGDAKEFAASPELQHRYLSVASGTAEAAPQTAAPAAETGETNR